MILTAANEYHPHRRMHHAVRAHLWDPRDACAEPYVHPARASLWLRDACAEAVACAWVDCMCAKHLHSSTLEHLNAVMVDQSAIGKPVHLQLGHAGDTCAGPRLGRVHLFGMRCVRRRGDVLP